MLAAMVETLNLVQQDLREVLGVIGLAPTISRADLDKYQKGHAKEIPVMVNDTYEIMNHSDLLLVTSGTATLESAYFGTPLIVLYRMSCLSWWIARRLVKIPDIGLVNVVAGNRIVPEYLQNEVDPKLLSPVVVELIRSPEKLRAMTQKMREVRNRLGTPGASSRVAELALEMVVQKGNIR